uniref:Uncharacterized protein n=1 Tax=Tetraselmis chuii TaxID=63592 RepID=A0A7S1X3R6_9CHLO
MLGLRDSVFSGWGHDSHPDLPRGTPDCFYPLPGKSCDLTDLIIEHHSEFAADVRPPLSGGQAGHRTNSLPGGSTQQAWMVSATSSHAHSADTHMQAFYNTQDVVDLATEFLRADLERFGYPEMVCGGCLSLSKTNGKAGGFEGVTRRI